MQYDALLCDRRLKCSSRFAEVLQYDAFLCDRMLIDRACNEGSMMHSYAIECL